MTRHSLLQFSNSLHLFLSFIVTLVIYSTLSYFGPHDSVTLSNFLPAMAATLHRPISYIFFSFLLVPLLARSSSPSTQRQTDPTPAPWPHQFHAILFMNYSGKLQKIDLWYDWTNGRNFNIIQKQLGKLVYDLEWNNGTSFVYTLDSNKECSTAHLEVGVLRPNWLDGSNYLGQRHVDGFLCNVWEKVDFIWYYEDVVTKRPVHWVFYTGREAHVMTFEVGAALEDAEWQAPVYCFAKKKTTDDRKGKLADGLLKGSMVLSS